MKHLLTLTLLCFGLLAQAQIPSYVPTNGLVGWWPFNGNANDESGNGNHGTVNGATLAADRFGNAGKAYSFGNNSQNIRIDSLTIKNITEYSFSVWFKKNSNGSNLDGTLISSTNGCNGSNSTGLRAFVGLDNQGYFTIETSNCFNGIGAGSNNLYLSDNNWHFLTGVFYSNNGSLDTSNFNIFIDGKIYFNKLIQQPNNRPVSPINSNGYPFVFGNSFTSNNYFFGQLDDIAIYNRALSASEVQQLYLGCQTQPSFTAQPQNKSVAQGQTTTFAVQVDSASRYQWQMNLGLGGGWTNIPTSALFLGDTTATLSVQGRSTIDGAQFRCIATSCKADTSNAATLTVTSSASAAAGTIAGVPGLINYQGSALDSAGKPMKNQTISLKLSVLDSSSSGAAVFVETHTATTNGSGHFAIQIGGGTANFGTFDSVGWANGRNKYLKTELSQNGTWVNLGTSQLVSVPYALHAGSAENAKRSQFILDDNNREIKLISRNGNYEFNLNQDTIKPSNLFNCGVSKINYFGQDYETVLIGTQCWLAKNLDLGLYKIILSNADSQSNNGFIEKYCMNNTQIKCVQNGGLYQWAEALNYNNVNNFSFSGNVIPQRGICPSGWHIPNDYEFNSLIILLGLNAGQKIKSASSGWAVPPSSNNNVGFNAVISGYASPHSTTFFQGIGNQGGNLAYFWSTSENTSTSSSCVYISDLNNDINFSSCNKKRGNSIRCLKD